MAKRSLHSKLNAIRQHVVSCESQAAVPGLPDRYHQFAEGLNGNLVSNFAGTFCLVRTLYPWNYTHGRVALDELRDEPDWLAHAFTPRDTPGTIPAADILCFDTETTGLGGAGAVAFLVGVGSVREDGFEVRQYAIPDYSDETAMLEALTEEFGEQSALVSYNGVTFDLPILRDRLIVNRVGRELPYSRHLDLLHTVRRIYRRRLGDCSLGNVERELFGFERRDDIPGYLVPSAYFSWLSEQRLSDMAAVMEHNRLDVVSLYFLGVCLSRTFRSKGEMLGEIDDLHSLSRVFSRRKDLGGVINLNARVEKLAVENLDDDVLMFHAEAFKRSGDLGRAVAIWQRVAESESREGCRANIQLSMYYEHRVRDIRRAYNHACRADTWTGLTTCGKRAVRKRLRRLTRKSAEMHGNS